MSAIILIITTGIIFLSGWNSANIWIEYRRKINDERQQACKSLAMNRVRTLSSFHVDGDD